MSKVPFEINFYYVVSAVALAVMIVSYGFILLTLGLDILPSIRPVAWALLLSSAIVFRLSGKVRHHCEAN